MNNYQVIVNTLNFESERRLNRWMKIAEISDELRQIDAFA